MEQVFTEFEAKTDMPLSIRLGLKGSWWFLENVELGETMILVQESGIFYILRYNCFYKILYYFTRTTIEGVLLNIDEDRWEKVFTC